MHRAIEYIADRTKQIHKVELLSTDIRFYSWKSAITSFIYHFKAHISFCKVKIFPVKSNDKGLLKCRKYTFVILTSEATFFHLDFLLEMKI